MNRQVVSHMVLWTASLAALPGCWSSTIPNCLPTELAHYQHMAMQIECPAEPAPSDRELLGTVPPNSLRDPAALEYWDLSLQEATRLALSRSKVLLDLGGSILRTPESVITTYGVAVQESSPQYGVEAALAAFDAQLSASFFAEKNDRQVNNQFVGKNGLFQQDSDVLQAQVTKRAVTGSQFTLRHLVDFTADNNIGNLFPGGAYDSILEGEFRHPLLQGGGIQFNRIAGPGASAGVFNGVLVARIRTDISLSEFEAGLRDFLSNVENAYWDLYFAYRDLDTKVKARDQALETWRLVSPQFELGRRGAEADVEAQAREQYFRFQEEVQNALVGRPLEGTRTYNGSSPGTFRALPGVYIAERRLRRLMGLPLNEKRMIRPADEPSSAPVAFDWCAAVSEALVRREELQRQRWQIKGRELELIAAKNFLLPNLDLVGRYRWRGFGHDLIDANRDNKPAFDNAYMDLTHGELQEWQLGAELSLPIGFRQAHVGVRNAQLRLAQARAVLREQERQVVHDLSNAVAELDRACEVLKTDTNRTVAARAQLDAVQAGYKQGRVEFYVVLDAQRRFADALIAYYQSRVEYVLALKNVHFEKGSLLDYCDVALAEGPWPGKAYRDAARRECLRGPEQPINYGFRRPPILSRGPCPPQPGAPPPLADPLRLAPLAEQPPDVGNPQAAEPSEPTVAPLPPADAHLAAKRG